MPNYPKLEKPLPRIFTSDHFASVDAAMQQLAIANALITKCERCKWPVEGHRAECDKLCSFYESFNGEWRGPQADTAEVHMT